MAVQLVWLKRDLRVEDHTALAAATRRGPTVVLYCWEPGLWSRPEYDASHAAFVAQCLDEVREGLVHYGLQLVERMGRIRDVLADLHRTVGIASLHAHEETGLGWTYGRDLAVARWCREHGVDWVEHQQTGVFRRLPSRDGWARRWETFMSSATAPPPEPGAGTLPLPSTRPTRVALGVQDTGKRQVQPGGSRAASALLDSFLEHRSHDYRRAMSSPVSGWDGCSRLSPYLAWGAISPRVVWQKTRRRIEAFGGDDQREQLEAFDSRLRWRDHFVQKLEDQPSLEFVNVHRGYDGVRRDPSKWGDVHHERLQAWIRGRTGFPMVDACMRCLHATGWINFRMRAMLASVATYHLWLHWRPVAVALAPHFLDFEPGIHFSQFQMQAGTTGINTNRIYNPAKQAREQDPTGTFIRTWVPELASLQTADLAAPYEASPLMLQMAGVTLGEDYPHPIVDPVRAVRAAKERMAQARARAGHKRQAAEVFRRHGSRRRQPRRRRF
jgi:deoxyribodipyrimidine photo-lyase